MPIRDPGQYIKFLKKNKKDKPHKQMITMAMAKARQAHSGVISVADISDEVASRGRQGAKRVGRFVKNKLKSNFMPAEERHKKEIRDMQKENRRSSEIDEFLRKK